MSRINKNTIYVSEGYIETRAYIKAEKFRFGRLHIKLIFVLTNTIMLGLEGRVNSAPGHISNIVHMQGLYLARP